MSINENIKKLREDYLDMSRETFAQEINLKRTAIYLIETGQRNPSDRTINDICEKFNINKEWLLTGEGEMYKPEPQIDELEYLMGKFSINANEDETRTKIIKALLKLDDNGWRVIEGLVDEILKYM